MSPFSTAKKQHCEDHARLPSSALSLSLSLSLSFSNNLLFNLFQTEALLPNQPSKWARQIPPAALWMTQSEGNVCQSRFLSHFLPLPTILPNALFHHNSFQFGTIHHNPALYDTFLFIMLVPVHSDRFRYVMFHSNSLYFTLIHFISLQFTSIHFNSLQFTPSSSTPHYASPFQLHTSLSLDLIYLISLKIGTIIRTKHDYGKPTDRHLHLPQRQPFHSRSEYLCARFR